MNKIIHLSDIHYGPRKLNEKFQTIIDNITDRMQPAEDYIILITGDLIDDGFQDRDHQRCKELIDLLTGANFKVLAVPGNHDYGRWGTGFSNERVNLFKKIYFENENQPYPKVDFSNDGKIVFIGLDSMTDAFNAAGYSSGAAGKMGQLQLDDLEDILANHEDVLSCEKRVIYLHHHPLYGKHDRHKLKDAEDFCRLVLKYRDKIDALLFGHNHYGTDWNGWLVGIPRCYDAGTSTGKKIKPEDLHPHRVIDLSLPVENDYDGKFLG